MLWQDQLEVSRIIVTLASSVMSYFFSHPEQSTLGTVE